MKITNVTSPGFEKLEAEVKRVEKAHDAAAQFESVLVRQMLHESKMFGKSQNGFTGMAVDAMADGIEKNGGLGLAQMIERALLEARK
jgi:Rod binding domain-containing protein